MQIAWPLRIDDSGRTAQAADDAHLRDMIQQVLFTTPGERVNQPNFGSGLRKLVFAPASDALQAAVQHTVIASLQQWLGDLIQVEAVPIESQDSTLTVTVQYLVRRTQERHVVRFQSPV
ncbi:MAG TPA: GPW/gp25 family protein [Myxococcales bacterium]|jgi:phage baseplate assembly protein W|nr:GPW/gp25 family protein [Myxococcales bacterium]